MANTSVFAISPRSSYSDPPSASASASTSSSSAGPSHIPAYTHIHSQQHDGNAILTTTPTSTPIKRGKTGCITCRIRKKRCDEAKPTCDSCARLGLECMGYSVQRPSWLKEKDMEMKLREEIKQKSNERRRSKKTGQPKTKTGPKPKPTPTPTAKGKGKAEPEPQPEQQIEKYQSEMGGNLAIVASSSNPFKRKRHKQDTDEEEEEEDDAMGLEDNHNISSSSMSGPSRSITVPTSSVLYPQVVAQSQNLSAPAPLTWAPLISSLNHPITGSLARHPWNPNHSQGPHRSQYQHPSPCPSPNAIEGPFTKSYTYPPPAEYYQNQYQSQSSSSNPDTPSSLIELSNPESPLEDLWIYLLNCQPDILSNLLSPSPIPPRSLSKSPSPDSVDRYFHHYLNVVLPLQFRFTMKSSAADLLAPLAMRDDTVMNGLKALAALHLSVYKNKDKTRNDKNKDSRGEGVVWDDIVAVDDEEELRTLRIQEDEGEEGEKDKEVAERSFDKTIKSLRSPTSDPNETDGLLVSSISAISYVIFSGGIASEWVEALRIARKYLWGALRDSPELGIFTPSTIPTSTHSHQKQKGSPWKRYRHFLQAIIRTDIFGSITENKASELLPIYRSLLNRSSIDFLSDGSGIGRANGLKEIVPNLDDIDNTTLLALAETVALSEWRAEQYQKGTLDLEELVRRGNEIKVLLNERSIRERQYFPNSNHHLHVRRSSSNGNEMEDTDTRLKGQLMSDAYYESTKILLSITINGPFPKLSTVQEPINEIINLIRQLKIIENRQTQSQTATTATVGTQTAIGTEKKKRMTTMTTGTGAITGTNEFIRTLIFPIAISACHCLPCLQPFFRGLFLNLNKNSFLFGNTKFIWMLIEKMWEERNIMTNTDSDEINGSEIERPIFWLDVMKELGWEGGILLI
ncbi:uncharacterized protein L199_004968 [Kwoniella botswanensis]|uniref:uncharacterized protein n=1 Tax=Kwoniella botswanensis TaxID=1268659 RepID=UPI00315DD348